MHPGDKISIEKLSGGRFQVKAARPAGRISDASRLLKTKRNGRSLSIEEMNEVIARAGPGNDKDYGRHECSGSDFGRR